MANDRPREITIHQSANRPNQILGGDRELVLVSRARRRKPRVQPRFVVGCRSEHRILDQRGRSVPAHGQGGPDDAACLHAAHPLQVVLSGKKRPAFDVSANAGPVEVVS